MSFHRRGELPFDLWTLVHVASGAALGILVSSFWLVLGLLVGYEAFEGILRNVRRDPDGKGLFEYESWPNIVADVVMGMAGFIAVRVGLLLAGSHWALL